MMQHDDLAIEIEAPEGGKAFELKVDWRSIAKTLTKGVLSGSFGDYATALKTLIDAADGLRKKPAEPPTPAEQGWLWLHRGAMAALAATIRGNLNLTSALGDSDREMDAFVHGAQSADPLSLTPAFFDHPADSLFFDRLKEGVTGWLHVLGADIDEQGRIIRRLRQEFPIALDLDERRRRADYEGLALFFQPTMVGEEAKRQRAWRRYRALLVDEVRKPIFNFATNEPGAVSLKEIYVPLRAVYFRPSEERGAAGLAPAAPDAVDRPQHKPVFVWLADHIDDWLRAAKSNDALRIVSGDPGSGKSAFGMMAAARWAREGLRVLRVPLTLIDFERDAFAAIRVFAERDEQLTIDPFDGLTLNDPVILLLDGLDELSNVNEQAGAAARTFVENLWQNMFRVNNVSDRARVLALLAGRPIVTRQSTDTFRDPGQRVDILRLKVKPTDYLGLEDNVEELLDLDQRDEWWCKYGHATRQPIDGLPEEYKYKGRQIDEITAQPLLNYLLALVRDQQLRDNNTTTIVSVHALYINLFELLYQRRKGRFPSRYQAEDCFAQSDYKRFLEEVAIAAWHGGDRSVTKDEITKRIETCDPLTQAEIKSHYDSLESGIFAILSSFFVAPESGGGPGIYTFTHKSFREFLTASRVVREVETIDAFLSDRRLGCTPEMALGRWYALTGRVPMDEDLLAFVREEVTARGDQQLIGRWRETLKTMFCQNLRVGMPGFEKAPDFRTAALRDRNAETGLFLLLSTCHQEGVLDINWHNQTSALDFLRRTVTRHDRLVLSCLRGIDMKKRDLALVDLFRANLAGANLEDANLWNANLEGVDLNGATLQRAYLFCVNLRNANLWSANLEGANLEGAYLNGANLAQAKLEGAYLTGANLEGVNLRGANLKRAKLRSAKLNNADCTGANFEEADLTDASYTGANLERTIGFLSGGH